ncbi:sensor histidine kinase [Tengunoibacter tsumagoiensis]|uniref:histidine kinase n=1 Tax=Tengunoibacter tsumagoiensis TaxID=2014871 RepID=A0A401ZU95_9CHLR|nr:ATP-binding protein [Tengunoibacter tsumagoiensis]GCE10485.1 hypothetical protein KTT_03440 [Tengunoibacter tsumagoiensis]
MSISTWRGPESNADDMYPLALLRSLLKQMMVEFGAQGSCIALYDESIGQMRIHTHVRLVNMKLLKGGASSSEYNTDGSRSGGRRVTIKLFHDANSGSTRKKQTSNELVDVTAQQNELFAVGTTYPMGQDLIGYAWHKNEAYAMRHEDYVTLFHANHPLPIHPDFVPLSYLVVPIREVMEEGFSSAQPAQLVGVIVLYQLNASGTALHKQHLEDALDHSERVALYLQNNRLHRAQHRSSEYLKLLQGISTTFPTSVKLSDLVESVYQFVSRVVDVSSMLLTLYDRDLDRLYDVLAVRDGRRVHGIVETPRVMRKEERPLLWHITQQAQPDNRAVLFSPAQEPHKAFEYQELLTGVWGDQRQAESFLLLPMKMLNRVVGSLCITSMRPHAYHPEEILVLETMTQIVTVGIENAKLYERDRDILERYRHLLTEANQREAELAAVNSTLQSIASVLNVTELLNKLVTSVAQIVNVEMCAFFELSTDKSQLYAHALYAPSNVKMIDDGSGLPIVQDGHKSEHDQLINLIQIPFKGTFLEAMIFEGFFYLDPAQLEELANRSSEGGLIFLREMGIQYMLIIPMSYQGEFMGFLAVKTPTDSRSFRPKDVGTLLAISAQAASAIRNAQFFEQREIANAELERLNKLKDEFLVTASHELRTPLTAISGYSSQLKRQSARATPQQVQKFANKIAVASQQLIDLVANMTEAAQIGPADRKLDLHLESVQVLAAAEIAKNMLNLTPEQNIFLEVSPTIWLRGDASKLRQVLTNLMENAVKYSPPESAISVSASVLQLSEAQELLSDDQVDPALLVEHKDIPVALVRVRDQGEGILPGDRQRIFEKFVRAPRSLTTPIRGSGLGLYICRRFIEAMGGKLWLEQSNTNVGSTFSFYLPYVEPPQEAGE